MEKLVPIIPIRDGIIFPNIDSVLTFGRPKSLAALESSFQNERIVCFVLQKNSKLNEPTPADLYSIGTLSRIERMIRSDGEINAQVKGISRVKILSYESHEQFLLAKVKELFDDIDDSPEIKALCNHITNQFKKAINLGKSVDFLAFMNIMSDNSPSELADLISSVLDVKPAERQELLETTNVKERLEKGAREAMLRERLKTIERELGQSDEDSEVKELSDKIKVAGMPEDVEEKAKKELKKLGQMNQFNPEAGYIRNYLDWLISLPWGKESKNNIDIKAAEKILDEDHYGLSKVKERIVEYLAVHKLAGKMKGPILCFVGPPGVGKTSIGKSIARALG